MWGFFGLCLLAFALFSVYDYKKNPQRYLDKKSGEPMPERSVKFTAWAIGVVGFLVMVGGFGGGQDAPDTAPQKAADLSSVVAAAPADEVKPPLAAQPVEQKPNLGMTHEQFRKALNAKIRATGISWLQPVAEFDIDRGEGQPTFKAVFGDIGLVGAVSDDGTLQDLTFIMGKSEKGVETASSMVLLCSMTAQIIYPDIPKNEIGPMVMALIEQAMSEKDTKENGAKKTIGQVKMWSMASDQLGIWFGFSPVDGA